MLFSVCFRRRAVAVIVVLGLYGLCDCVLAGTLSGMLMGFAVGNYVLGPVCFRVKW